ncbi:MAG: PD-(D/E)XK nuclease family transposase [Lachnospiraceae bacterium]
MYREFLRAILLLPPRQNKRKNEVKRTLTGLVSALLHINPDDVKSIEIQNPIELGKVYDDKEFILDISLLLNDDTYINLEMQVSNNNDWPERSLSYLCRSFDQLNRGQAYLDAKPVIHIGILNYTLFENAPEFYATYELQNIRTQQTYSRKLSLNVLDLTQIDRATEEYKCFGIDRWAGLFRATTWEELRMITKNNEYMDDGAQVLLTMNSDQTIRDMCYFRERAEIEEKYRNDLIKKQEAELAKKDKDLAEKDRIIAELQAQLASQK